MGRWFGQMGIVLLLTGCFVTPDEELWKRRVDVRHDGGVEATAGDLGIEAGGSCSAVGNPWPCDPVNLTGCAQGACYVLPTAGQACLCPVGTLEEGAACNTTTLCKPGTLCAGTAPPGVCRSVCHAGMDASVCPTGRFCRFLTQHPAFGYCDLLPDAGPDAGPADR